MRKKKNTETRTIDNPYLFVFASLALFVCIIVIIFGLLNFKGKESDVVEDGQKKSDSLPNQEDLGDYFDKEFEVSERQKVSDVFLRSDPYVEACASTAGDDKPSIVDGTVCLR
ncbi:MAG: hypothetical protein UT08_C0009G0057 [Candidatus Woesebacteria bacterium GW2011_GWB1_38_8]|uniref:Uncharacterized protein n=1 Tax=Candidatus Woesebacteria bacterium GW2011_GWB1_38_8 TaxID=1618570 RepID=A0A0G0KZW3_9BACT|nr:MAG: hypothetical protein UT08_C0009G0057 [Candidatus Woesebacteria bacterium GW2011_GWB1_38_8]